MKHVYALQPYHVGGKKSRSLAIVIPSEVARNFDIDTSTIFSLKVNETTRTVVFKSIHSGDED